MRLGHDLFKRSDHFRRGLLAIQFLAHLGSDRWTLVLAPLDAQMKGSVRDITLYGRGAELRCIETRPLKGDLQRTLLAGAAKDAANASSAEALAALCRAGATR